MHMGSRRALVPGYPAPNLSTRTILIEYRKFFGQNIRHKWMHERSSQIFIARQCADARY